MEKLEAVNWMRVLGIVLVGGAAWLGARKVTRLVRDLVVHGDVDLEHEKRTVTLVRAVRYALSIAIWLVVIMLLLSEFGISIAPLLGAAGIAGAVMGFAAQGIARDFLRGFALLLDNHLRVGDQVEIAGKSGSVEEVTLRHVRLREYDGTVHFVHTGEIGTVTNQSYGRAFAVLDVAIDTAADPQRAMQVVRECADAMAADAVYAARVAGPVEIAGIDRWDDDTVVIRARVAVTPNSQAAVRREWLTRVKAEFERAGIPNPTQRLLVVTERNSGA